MLKHRLQFNPGARELCAALKTAGLKLLLVSGGFTYFTRFVAAELGMDFVRSNELAIADGALTGGLVMQAWGEATGATAAGITMLGDADASFTPCRRLPWVTAPTTCR